MPRTGKHPLKFSNNHKDNQQNLVTITSVTHIPIIDGYWKESLEILKIFFENLVKNTPKIYDLIIFDNNSCEEVKNFLVDLSKNNIIDTLILSKKNIKKLGAMNKLFSIAEGSYVVFTDSDVLLLSGWLEKTLEIFYSFPEAGQVSAIPTIDKYDKFVDATIIGINMKKDIIIEKGDNLIPDKFIDNHRISIGKTKAEYLSTIRNRIDTKVTRNEISAFVSAQDFQFTTTKEVISKILPLKISNQNEFYDSIYSPIFEKKINDLGYWRLSTTDYLVHHLGNDLKTSNTQNGL